MISSKKIINDYSYFIEILIFFVIKRKFYREFFYCLFCEIKSTIVDLKIFHFYYSQFVRLLCPNLVRLLVAKSWVLHIISLGSVPSPQGCSFLFRKRMRGVTWPTSFVGWLQHRKNKMLR